MFFETSHFQTFPKKGTSPKNNHTYCKYFNIKKPRVASRPQEKKKKRIEILKLQPSTQFSYINFIFKFIWSKIAHPKPNIKLTLQIKISKT